jgi:carbon storage regulator
MLVIRRRAGQSVLIGDNIEIEVVETSAGKVKLGITAPREILVLRSEIKLTGEQNRIAAQAVTSQEVGKLLEKIQWPLQQDVEKVAPMAGEGKTGVLPFKANQRFVPT